MPGKVIEDGPILNQKDISKLLSYASILSLSENKNEISKAYDIVTRLLEVPQKRSSYVISGANIILSRIGNFPGRDLLHKRHNLKAESKISSILLLECIARETENSLYHDGSVTTLTDFQYKLYQSLNEESSLSVSAPTSAGKSFVLNLDLIRRIRDREKQSIVYIVPTRALISEVSQRIRATLRKENLSDIAVRTAPFPIAKEDVNNAVVYVLTQERLLSLIGNHDVKPYVTALIVDEAHEIKKGKRGIVLQNAIEITLLKFPQADVLFASPLIENPDYFLSLFGRFSSGKYFVETVSPVSQNVILVSEVKRKTKHMNVSFLAEGNEISIGHVAIDFKLRGSKATQKANLAISISLYGEDSIIVFSNGPADAEKVAEKVAELAPNIMQDFTPSDDILAFVDFLRKDIHPEYPLAKCLLYGVAFHYGKMPSLVRAGVEKFFKSGDIKIICCTSTLLQGVNLPAKHIIIENPTSGPNAPMGRSDFLNLAGRAGRLLEEFHGNIWCIRPMDWDEKCYEGDQLQNISSAISNLMVDGGLSIQKLLDSTITDPKIKDEAEAAFGKLYHDYIVDPKLAKIEIYRDDENSAVLDETIKRLKNMEINIPLSILENNKSLRPDHLQNVYNHLCGQLFLEENIPLSPYVPGGKMRMDFILKVIVKCFEWELSDKYMGYISYLSYRWVRGTTIGAILIDRVSFVQNNDPGRSVSGIIRDCLGVLEDAVRFKLVKYFSAYIEILRVVLQEKELDHLIDDIEPYHIYLEFGSCNRNALCLMALGLSRFSALHLQKKINFIDGIEVEEHLVVLKNINPNELDIPILCKNEIRDLIA